MLNFKNKKSFVAFITCGDPDIETTKKCIKAVADAGADLIELGIPFSDPTAEGPTIMEANKRALDGGVTTEKIFEMVREIRSGIDIPLAFMTYANVVFSYKGTVSAKDFVYNDSLDKTGKTLGGTEKFLKQCKSVGINALILPDVPFEESDEFVDVCDKYDVDFISLVSPVSDERIKMIAKNARGFLYIVSSLGVTGERSQINDSIQTQIKEAKKHSPVPCFVGFGISTPEQAKNMSENSDGVIVGSAIVRLIESYGKYAPKYVYEYVKSMTDAIR